MNDSQESASTIVPSGLLRMMLQRHERWHFICEKCQFSVIYLFLQLIFWGTHARYRKLGRIRSVVCMCICVWNVCDVANLFSGIDLLTDDVSMSLVVTAHCWCGHSDVRWKIQFHEPARNLLPENARFRSFEDCRNDWVQCASDVTSSMCEM